MPRTIKNITDPIRFVIYIGLWALCLGFIETVPARGQNQLNIDSLENIMENGRDSVLVESSNELFFHFISTEPERSISYINRSLEIALENNDLYGIANAYNVRGIYYQRRSEYEKAIEMHTKSLDYYDQANDHENKGWGLNNIGTVYLYLKNFDKAKEYLKQAYDILKSSGHQEGIATTAGNLGSVYSKLEQYDQALELFDESLKVSIDLGLKFDQGRMLNNKGVLYSDQENYPLALESFERALQLFVEVNETYAMMSGYRNVGAVRTKLGQFEKAESSLLKSIELSKKYKARLKTISAYQVLVELYESKKDYKSAFHYQKLIQEGRDSILSKQNLDKINELEARYQNEVKEREIEQLNNEKRISELESAKSIANRNIAVAGSLLTVIIAVLFVNRLRLKQQTVKNHLEMINLDIQHRLLRAQMNPHFIFNSLNSIQSYINENESLIAEKYLMKFAGLIRLILESTSKSYITLNDDIKIITLYLELEQLRLSNKFQFVINIDNDLNPEEVEIPPMMSQPFIENAVLHGIRHKQSGGEIIIDFRRNQELLICNIRDNGIGRLESARINADRYLSHQSMSTKLASDRADKIKIDSQLDVGIQIDDLVDDHGDAQGTSVTLRLPYKDF